jgi:hypothetical protein
MLSLTVFHQSVVQLGVRKVSLAIILLDFDAITGEFGGLRRRVVTRQTSQACVGERVMARVRGTVFRGLEILIRI